jgi:hypothetical protein
MSMGGGLVYRSSSSSSSHRRALRWMWCTTFWVMVMCVCVCWASSDDGQESWLPDNRERASGSFYPLRARFWFHIKKLRNFFPPNLLKIREFIVERRWRPSTRLCIKRTGNYSGQLFIIERGRGWIYLPCDKRSFYVEKKEKPKNLTGGRATIWMTNQKKIKIKKVRD